MFKERTKASLLRDWRLRLKAGALTLVFALLTLLPWAHMFTLDSHDGHRCCQHSPSAISSTPHTPADSSAFTSELPDSCWICNSLASLLHSNALRDAPPLITHFHSFAAVRHSPPALLLTPIIYPSSRSQAPPALI